MHLEPRKLDGAQKYGQILANWIPRILEPVDLAMQMIIRAPLLLTALVWGAEAFAPPPPCLRGGLSAAGSLCVRRMAAEPAVPVCVYVEHAVKTSKPGPPAQDITVEDLTPAINALVASSGVREGTVTVVSRHTTTAITINEWESRLVDDIRSWLLRLAPPDDRSAVATPGGGVSYYHNDIDKRPDSEDERQRCKDNGWDIDCMDGPKGLAAWRAQEPINAHSHLLSMILGSSEAIPVHKGKIVLGQWQSVMLVIRVWEGSSGIGCRNSDLAMPFQTVPCRALPLCGVVQSCTRGLSPSGGFGRAEG